MQCRVGCGACCIAPSITSSIPGMEAGKPAGTRCVNLDKENRCILFGDDARPKVCVDFEASEEFCGLTSDQALKNYEWLELKTGE